MTSKKNTTATPAQPAKAPSRKDLLARLEAKGYAGPTSFTATVLREVVAWVEAGSPKDKGDVPTGALHAVYPELKPAPKAKAARLTKAQQGYQQALAEVAALADLASIQKWVADNRVALEA
jgi:hypothetical protein